MILKPNSIPKIFLKPGEMHFAVNPTIVTTVLGSCIAVTMYSKELHTGAICHAILPEELMTGDPYRYVDSSIRAMLQRFQRHGIKKESLEIKLFGGADILPPSGSDYRTTTVGKQNIFRADEVIKWERLQLVASDVGGRQGRKLLFYTHSGEVYLQRLRDITR